MLIEFLQQRKITFTEGVPICSNKHELLQFCVLVECILDRLPQQRFSIHNTEKLFGFIDASGGQGRPSGIARSVEGGE
jgi:hypothetical protein